MLTAIEFVASNFATGTFEAGFNKVFLRQKACWPLLGKVGVKNAVKEMDITKSDHHET